MSLSSDLISEFVKATKDTPEQKKESTVYGTVTRSDGDIVYVKFDGAETETPVSKTVETTGKTLDHEGDRVIVTIKNHRATITSNLTDHAVTSKSTTVKDINDSISNKVSTEQLDATNAKVKALGADKLDASAAKITYADINFTNIANAAIEKIFAGTGIIKDLTFTGGTVTGELTGVKINGNLINANTIKADSLIVKGKDGLYYRLNAGVDGVTETELATEEYQSKLHGDSIIAKTITAEHIKVTDLFAFGATIGGFHITDASVYSGVKLGVYVENQGIYLGSDGEFAIGNAEHYIRCGEDDGGIYMIDISASSLTIDAEDLMIQLGDKGKIEYDSTDEYLQLYGDNLRLRAAQSAALYCDWYDGQSNGSKSYVETYSNAINLTSSDSTSLDPETGVGTWRSSNVSIRPDEVAIISDVVRINGIPLTSTIDGISINGIPYAKNKILWNGYGEAYYMDSSQTVTLSERIADQANGIVLVFSRYSNDTPRNYHFSTHFVPKAQVTQHGGCGHSFLLTSDGSFSLFASKYLYLEDDADENVGVIRGSDINTQSGTGDCGITYSNAAFILRYVIGV